MTTLSETILPNNILTDSNTQTVTNKTILGNSNVVGLKVDASTSTFALPTASAATLGQTVVQSSVGMAVLDAGVQGLRGISSGKELIYAAASDVTSNVTLYDFPTLIADLRTKYSIGDYDSIELELRCLPINSINTTPAIKFYNGAGTLLTGYNTVIQTLMLLIVMTILCDYLSLKQRTQVTLEVTLRNILLKYEQTL